MRHWLALLLTLLVVCSLSVSARESDRWAQAEFLPGRLIVDFTPQVKVHASSVDDALMATGVESLDALFTEYEVRAAWRLVPDGTLSRLKVAPDLYSTYVLEFNEGALVLDALDRFAADSHVRRIEPDVVCRTFRTPNDSYWTQQWDKRIVGANTVWDVATGTRAIVCAGIDVGVDWRHADLTPNLWVNPGEDVTGDSVAWTSTDYPGDWNDVDGTDNDSNGYVDDLLGWDFIQGIHGCAQGEDCDGAMDNNMLGLNSHGTHVAGLMVARGNNGIGVAGMSWYGRLMALRAGYEDESGNGYIPESASAPAILYAAANGANILNMSYGGPSMSEYAQEVINSAWDQGCILFAASGNDGSTTPQYPANFANVIAVNSTDNDDGLSYFSNRGTWTDLCSPGGDPGIMSTVVGSYGIMEGTSMASPNAAGVAALVWSIFPQMTNAQLRDLLFNTAADIHAQNPSIPVSYLGHGRISARNAVASLYPQMRITTSTFSDSVGGDNDGRLEAGETVRLYLTVTNVTGWANGDSLTAVVSAADSNLTITNNSWYLGAMATGQSRSNSSSPVLIRAAGTLDTAYWRDIHVIFSSPSGYAETQSLTIRIGRGRVLVVDDDGTANYEQYYVTGATTSGVSSDLWSVNTDGVLPEAEMSRYPVLIWSCGDRSSSTLTAEDQGNLMTYLDAGNKLILIGQNIDEDLRTSPFYANYLHAQSEQLAGERQVGGINGNPVSEGMSLLLVGALCAGNGSLSPSRILPRDGAVAMFDYAGGGTGAIQYEGTYKLAYFAFALEAACGSNNTNRYDEVISSVLNWMGALDARPAVHTPQPLSLALHGNYPNPFNPSTTISFDVATPARVTLRVYDILGQSVATLVDGPLSAGSHSAVFDGSRLASGVYLVRLQSGAVSLSSKMVLMK
ncbi:MAG TPA: S8 family serine peptidase [bacterium]|jgi:subtilisin family serine protease